MQKHLATDFTANYLTTNMEDNDKGEDVLSGKLHEKVIDMEWVTAIEDTLPYIEKAIDEQRRFIEEHNEVYRVDKAKIINKDSVKHLIQHTNFIDNIEDDGRVTPNKVLTIEREDSFETYENRFLITLIENALDFVSDKYRKMVDAPTDTFDKMHMERDMELNNQHIFFKIEYSNEVKDAKADDLDVRDFEKLSDFDRVRRIREKLNSFLNTDMMHELKKCIRVKPPINRTNLMTKNPNYKASLDLFNYLYAYNKPGYEIVGKDFSGKMDKDVQESMYMSMGFQHFMMTIATNPALKKMLEERYQERKQKQQGGQDSEVLELVESVRKEEMKIRLQEIREREKIIREQKAEIAALKREIEKRDKQIESLKSTIKALEDEVKDLKNQVQQLKAELIKAKERIEELEAKVKELEARIEALEAQVAALEAKVAELEKIKAELEAKIAELEQIIEEQKARIAELEEIVAQQKARIEALEAYVAELEQIKAELEERVSALEAENAQQKATIESQAATITEQKDAIAALETEIAGAKQQITEITDTLAQRDKTISEQSSTIDGLNKNVEDLSKDLADERQARKDEVANLNKSFEDERKALADKHAKEIEKINNEHKSAMDKLDKQKESEKAKIQKDADSRVKVAQKEADKRAKDEIKKQVTKAQAEAKKAAKKANDTAAMYRKELKIDRGNDGLFKFDYTIGALGIQALKAHTIAESGSDMGALPHMNNLQSLFVIKDNRKITVCKGSFNHLEVLKNFRGSSNFDDCKDFIKESLDTADKSCAYITYKTMDKNYMSNFISFLSTEAGFMNTQLFHNKGQKNGKSIIGIYFYKG
jgi:predicted  nucleic acid-binding Zn-ribbon protein